MVTSLFSEKFRTIDKSRSRFFNQDIDGGRDCLRRRVRGRRLFPFPQSH